MRLFCQLHTSFTLLEQWNIMTSLILGLAPQLLTSWNASWGTDVTSDFKLIINPFVFAEGLWIIIGVTAVAPTEFFVCRGVLLAGINHRVALIHQLKNINTKPSLWLLFLQQTSSHAFGSNGKNHLCPVWLHIKPYYCTNV